MNNFALFKLPKHIKLFLSSILIALCIGVLFGMSYLFFTTNFSVNKATERFNGQTNTEETLIIEKYPKSTEEMLTTVHTHIISFVFIFFIVGSVFSLNTLINGKFKTFLLFEPPISVVVSFGSIFAMRFLNPAFIYLTIVFSTVMYLSLFLMIFVSLWELNFKKAV